MYEMNLVEDRNLGRESENVSWDQWEDDALDRVDSFRVTMPWTTSGVNGGKGTILLTRGTKLRPFQ